MKRTALRRKTPLKSAAPIRTGKAKTKGMDMTQMAIPKPKKPALDWITVYADGREVLNTNTPKGSEEYRLRKWKMRDRQGEVCCLFGFIPECPGALKRCDTSFEHEDGRGAGKHDDRIEKDGQPYNGASHCLCNQIKGSRYIDFNSRGKLSARKAA